MIRESDMAKPKRSSSARMSSVARQDRAEVAQKGPPRSVTLKPLIRTKTHKLVHRPDFECIALVLQGGGALGSYQAGVYQALAEANLDPDWVAGVSIGGFNAAIIAGNAPETRVGKLREFWELLTSSPFGFSDATNIPAQGDDVRNLLNRSSAWTAAMLGVPGFYEPRPVNPFFAPTGTMAATSFYDTRPLKATLERLVDFDRINSEANSLRLSLGAVNVRTGGIVYFDSTMDVIRPEHVMASGAIPPGFPAIEIDGEYYWDGGLLSNTPLQWMATNRLVDSLVFQVDLWSGPGEFPRNMAEVLTRMKEIQWASRTRSMTDYAKYLNKLHYTVASLLEVLPEALKESDAAKFLSTVATRRVHSIVLLNHRPSRYEGSSKDHEFSRRSMEERWRAGYDETVRTLRRPEVLQRPDIHRGTLVAFDAMTGSFV
jgi:NTE family protein